MFEKSDAFVALPGGIGTVEEIVEVMTWAQLGRHRKPIVFVNVKGFWDPMMAMIDHMRAEGFVHTGHLVHPLVVDKPEEVVRDPDGGRQHRIADRRRIGHRANVMRAFLASHISPPQAILASCRADSG